MSFSHVDSLRFYLVSNDAIKFSFRVLKVLHDANISGLGITEISLFCTEIAFP